MYVADSSGEPTGQVLNERGRGLRGLTKKYLSLLECENRNPYVPLGTDKVELNAAAAAMANFNWMQEMPPWSKPVWTIILVRRITYDNGTPPTDLTDEWKALPLPGGNGTAKYLLQHKETLLAQGKPLPFYMTPDFWVLLEREIPTGDKVSSYQVPSVAHIDPKTFQDPRHGANLHPTFRGGSSQHNPFCNPWDRHALSDHTTVYDGAFQRDKNGMRKRICLPSIYKSFYSAHSHVHNAPDDQWFLYMLSELGNITSDFAQPTKPQHVAGDTGLQHHVQLA